MSITLDQLKKAFAKNKDNDPLGGMPYLSSLPKEENDEYRELIQITQNATGKNYIASNGDVMVDPLVTPFLDRMRELIAKDKAICDANELTEAELQEQATTILDKIRARAKARKDAMNVKPE